MPAVWWTDEVRIQHKVAIVGHVEAPTLHLMEFHLHLISWQTGVSHEWGSTCMNSIPGLLIKGQATSSLILIVGPILGNKLFAFKRFSKANKT